MIRYAGRRLAQAVPLLLGVATLVFLAVHAAPGDPASVYFHPDIPPEVARSVRESMGLEEPLHVQYLSWLRSVGTGDLGYSYSQGRPVADAVAAALPDTLLLGGTALILTFLLGVGLGVAQGARAGTTADRWLSGGSLLLYSVPGFWLALMLILLFSSPHLPDFLRLPLTGATSVGYDGLGPWGRALDRARHLLLPAAALALPGAAGVSRYMRASVVQAMGQDYVRAARSRGLPEWRVVGVHAARNALLPVISLFGLYVPRLLGGAVVVEVVFAWGGMGRLLYTAVLARDYPLVLAGSLLFGVLVVAGNLAADLLYAAADPRVRQGEARGS